MAHRRNAEAEESKRKYSVIAWREMNESWKWALSGGGVAKMSSNEEKKIMWQQRIEWRKWLSMKMASVAKKWKNRIIAKIISVMCNINIEWRNNLANNVKMCEEAENLKRECWKCLGVKCERYINENMKKLILRKYESESAMNIEEKAIWLQMPEEEETHSWRKPETSRNMQWLQATKMTACSWNVARRRKCQCAKWRN